MGLTRPSSEIELFTKKTRDMKKILGMIVVILLLAACATENTSNDPTDKWNGYFDRLKDGEVIHTLWAGQHIDVGTVTYGIDNDANFYVTYNCTGGWMLSETHMFAGDKKDMPLNKPGKPKIGKFPHSADHDPWVSTYTYYVPLTDLPPAEDPGFVVATHSVVQNPNGGNETAWGEGAYTFTDKGWGWYDVYYFNQPDNPYTILYGVEYGADDSLRLWLLDVTNGGSESELILTEYVGGSGGEYDGTAYDPVSGNFFFANPVTGELYVNDLTGEDPSFSAGTLIGTVKSADFYDNGYYYVDADDNTIHLVTFDSNWQIISNDIISTIPSSVEVTDIAINPDGDYMYIVGNVGDGTTEMITWDMVADTYSTISLTVADGTQIAYGSDGLLYAIEPSGDNEASAYVLDTDTGISEPIEGDPIIIIDDPFSDISKGTIM